MSECGDTQGTLVVSGAFRVTCGNARGLPGLHLLMLAGPCGCWKPNPDWGHLSTCPNPLSSGPSDISKLSTSSSLWKCNGCHGTSYGVMCVHTHTCYIHAYAHVHTHTQMHVHASRLCPQSHMGVYTYSSHMCMHSHACVHYAQKYVHSCS